MPAGTPAERAEALICILSKERTGAAQGERRALRDLQTGWIAGFGTQARMRDACDLELLLLHKRMAVMALREVSDDGVGEVLLLCIL